ncbi:Zn-dependent protease with chaperone function [Lentzea waywayandensis]|uniref:Zn-dependent protease with chaperone function n=1 Tax=Lentzea waywayandensis TaxID=84724 RepID=A0A1I6DBA2_9PSEU|nr:M48 family metalloprotease [Lentzea waywayandensis]SFR02657.1 Zn-dependent protease with chaperone function [Lentzea waywayandensis]
MTDTEVEGGSQDDTAHRPVPHPHGVPAGTTTRFALLIAVVVATSSTMFMLLHLLVPANSARQAAAQKSCFAEVSGLPPLVGPDDVSSRAEAAARVTRCLAPVYLDEVSWAGYGLVLLFGLAVVLYWLHPWWITRRRRLVPLSAENSPELLAYLGEVSRQVGLDRAPAWLLAPYNVTAGGRAFGHVRRRRVQLDAGLVVLYSTDRAAFRAVVLHELAHLWHRDVDKTYLTLAIWRAYVVVALIPFVVGLLLAVPLGWPVTALTSHWTGTLAVLGSLLVLTVLVYLTRNAILRVRETHADAIAAVHDGPDGALRGLVGRLRVPTGPRWRALLSTHPDPRQRLAAIDDPAVLARPSLWVLAGAGIAAGLLATNLGFVFDFLFVTTVALGRGLVGVVIALVLSGLLAVTLWHAVAGDPERRLPWRTWLLCPTVLAAGFVLGESVSLFYVSVRSDQPGTGPGGVTAVVLTTLLLVAGGVLLSGWTLSVLRLALTPAAPRRRWAPFATVAAAGIVAAPWFAAWFVLRGLDLTLWTPIFGSVPGTGAEIGWYRTLAWWTDFTWLPLRYLDGNPLTLPGLTLLWLVPIIITVRRTGSAAPALRLGRALTTGLGGGVAVMVIGVALSYVAKSALPLNVRRDTTFTTETTYFGYVQLCTYITVAVLAQAVVAGLVAARVRRHRPALIALAVSLTGTLAAIGWLGVLLFSRCIDLYGTAPARCVPAVGLTDLTGYLHTILIKGLIVAVPGALLGAAVGALRRRRTHPGTLASEPARRAPALPVVAVALLAAVMIVAPLPGLAGDWNLWTGHVSSSTAAPDEEGDPKPPPVDACVVGTWIETANESHVKSPSGADVRFTSTGRVQRFRADGTAVLDFGTGNVTTGTLNGKTLQSVSSGTITFRYDTAAGQIRYSSPTASGTTVVTMDGVVQETRALEASVEPEHYVCQGDVMTQTGTSFTIQLARTSHTG